MIHDSQNSTTGPLRELILYNSVQFAHTKLMRVKYKLTLAHLTIFNTLYYITVLQSPTPRGIKRVVRDMTPQFNQEYIYKLLDHLCTVGLIRYETTSSDYKYILELTSEGIEVIESLYSEEAIGRLLDKY